MTTIVSKNLGRAKAIKLFLVVLFFGGILLSIIVFRTHSFISDEYYLTENYFEECGIQISAPPAPVPFSQINPLFINLSKSKEAFYNGYLAQGLAGVLAGCPKRSFSHFLKYGYYFYYFKLLVPLQDSIDIYLNIAPFGSTNGKTILGIQNAAKEMYNLNQSEIKLREVATIFSFINRTNANISLQNSHFHVYDRDENIKLLARFGYISDTDKERALSEKND